MKISSLKMKMNDLELYNVGPQLLLESEIFEAVVFMKYSTAERE